MTVIKQFSHNRQIFNDQTITEPHCLKNTMILPICNMPRCNF